MTTPTSPVADNVDSNIDQHQEFETTSQPVHAQIDPRLSLPEHLQTTQFDEDIWRRMTGSNFRHPLLTARALREDPDSRDLLRGAIAAASEREKEVLMHNQARFFSSLLYALARNVGNFLNTPVVPNSVKHPPKQSVDKESGNPFRELILFLLTPKTMLTIALLAFGVIAGYSQLQIKNLEKTVTSYETLRSASEAAKEDLEIQIANINGLVQDRDTKILSLESMLASLETGNGQLATNLSEYENKHQLEIEKNQSLVKEIDDLKKGKQSTTAELQAKLVELNSQLEIAKNQLIEKDAALQQVTASLASQKEAKESIIKERDRLLVSEKELHKDIADLELKASSARQRVGLLYSAEQSLKNIKLLIEKYNYQVNDRNIMEYIDQYDARKARHERISQVSILTNDNSANNPK